jgi:hypothetical protein
MFTEYPKVLNYFQQAIKRPNLELKDIIDKFIYIKAYPNDVGAALYLVSAYHEYQDHLAKLTANASVK